jgi:hypothetical protein
MSNQRAAYDPAECHEALTTINPSYAHLTVTQRPSWVRPPSSYSINAVSSLSVAFEDPDGSKIKAMLADRYLYVFGTRATVKKWKHRPRIRKDTLQTPATQQTADGDSASEDDEVEIVTQLTHIPRAEINAQARTHAFSTPSPTTGSFGQYSTHQQTSPFGFGISQTTSRQSSLSSSFGTSLTTPRHQSLFGGSSPVTPIPESDQQEPQRQPSSNNKKAPPAPAKVTPSFSTPSAPTRTSGSNSPPPAPARTRSHNPPRNAKGKKTIRAA